MTVSEIQGLYWLVKDNRLVSGPYHTVLQARAAARNHKETR